MPPKPTRREGNKTPLNLTKTIAVPAALLTLAALASQASQAGLSAVYGSIPSAQHHQQAMTGTILLALLSKSQLKHYLPSNTRNYLPVLVYWIPTMQYLLFSSSSRLGPSYGPLVTELLTFLPLLFLSTYDAAEGLHRLDLNARFGPSLAELLPAVAAYVHFSVMEKAFSGLLPQFFNVADMLAPFNLFLLLASMYAMLSPSWLCMLAIPAISHTARLNPNFISMHTMNSLNETLHGHNWSLVDRQWSNTGYISVLDNLDLQYRVMRCDHSLLGGEWILTEQRKRTEGWTVSEPIYAVFEMLEAVRLMQTKASSLEPKTALVIGLGIGTAPKALLAHGINTTVVELDPVVHDFATLYFDLPSNHTAVLQDAVMWVDESARRNGNVVKLEPSTISRDEAAPVGLHENVAQRSMKYDYIIHDVFTGGAEPLALFTKEFLRDLRSLAKSDGAIAINYAGDTSSPSTNLVLNTIRVVFDGQCKIYRDAPPPKTDAAEGSPGVDFLNMVVFCRNSPGDITFRRPTEADFLGSQSRRHYLQPRAEFELPFPLPSDIGSREESKYSAGKVLKRSSLWEWEAKQLDSASSHWEIMRKVVPAAVWELW